MRVSWRAEPLLYFRARQLSWSSAALAAVCALGWLVRESILPSAGASDWYPTGNPALLIVPAAASVILAGGLRSPLDGLERAATRRREMLTLHVLLMLVPTALLLGLSAEQSPFTDLALGTVRNVVLFTAVALSAALWPGPRLSWLLSGPYAMLAFFVVLPGPSVLITVLGLPTADPRDPAAWSTAVVLFLVAAAALLARGPRGQSPDEVS